MRKRVKKFLIVFAGVVCICLGLLGLVLPFLQGILFLMIGCALISLYSPRMRAFMSVHTVRFQKLHALLGRVEAWANKDGGD